MNPANRSTWFRARWACATLALGGALAACGGGVTVDEGDPGTGSPPPAAPSPSTPTPPAAPAPVPAPPLAVLSLPACEPTGVAGATDYQVGDGKAYTELHQVPWENLKAGDSVRLFYRATPFKGKFAITAEGDAAKPLRICGVRGPANERPIIEGNGAQSRTTQRYQDGLHGRDDIRLGLESSSVILLKHYQPTYTSFPANVQIFGLHIRQMHPRYSYTDSSGASQPYYSFGACINLNRGHNILIADNEISDCAQAIYSVSKDEGPFAVTQDIRIRGNYFHGNGYEGGGSFGADRMHTTYTASQRIVFEFNHYGPLRAGAMGNAIKDRSAGTVIRYNYIEEGARAMDLVDLQDFPQIALADPAVRSTLVYGNRIRKSGNTGSFIHYGGDSYREAEYRKGTLYFFHNTIYATGNSAALFQLSTTEERAEIWNNVFVFADSIPNAWRSLRQGQEVSPGYTNGGILNFGVNWISTGWQDSDVDHPIPGEIIGTGNFITGNGSPFDLSTGVPQTGSPLLDRSRSGPSAAAAYTVDWQLDATLKPVPRRVNGAAADLGAVER